jgi:hypothetical protein
VSSIDLEEGSVYITDATSFHHTVEYGATTLTDPHITMVCRLAEPETSAKTKTPLLNRKAFVTTDHIQALHQCMEAQAGVREHVKKASNEIKNYHQYLMSQAHARKLVCPTRVRHRRP